jgi:hypothetical protein
MLLSLILAPQVNVVRIIELERKRLEESKARPYGVSGKGFANPSGDAGAAAAYFGTTTMSETGRSACRPFAIELGHRPS